MKRHAIPIIAAAIQLGASPINLDGMVDPRVTQESIHENICRYGYTQTVRPPRDVMAEIKREMAREKGVDPRRYQLNHIVPLELGGSPLDRRNLELEPYDGPCGARVRDRLEFEMSRRVCAGEIPLADAQAQIVDDWVEAYERYVDPRGCAH